MSIIVGISQTFTGSEFDPHACVRLTVTNSIFVSLPTLTECNEKRTDKELQATDFL